MTAPIVATSLKMYFTRERTLDYATRVREIAESSDAVRAGDVVLALLPDHLTLAEVATTLASTPVRIGAQDICQADRGAYTGEVSAIDVAALGGTLAELGHAERRTIYGETDEMVAAKADTARRNGLTPLLCIGEPDRCDDPADAARACAAQVRAVLADSLSTGETWLAYEPYWAIGAPEPAPKEYVIAVAEALRAELGSAPYRLLYGGSAGPGVLTALWPAVDGVFLGRFAHDPAALRSVVEEAAQL